MKLSQKQNTFSHSFFAFWKSRFYFERFQKNMALIVYVFLNSRTPKKVVSQMPRNSRFRGPLDK